MTGGPDSPVAVAASASPDMNAEFVGALLHKFSQPLTALRGSLELALEFSSTPEEYRQGIQEAIEQADRMVRLKKVLMELTGRYDLKAGAERTEVGSVLQAALEDSLPVAEHLGVRLETSCPVPLFAEICAPRVTQAFCQLLNTFIEYSTRGTTVMVTCLRSNDDAVTTFANTRGEIPERDLPRLFDAFFPSSRASEADSSVWRALARKIIEASGGSLLAENIAPQGFRFLIRLPLTATRRTEASHTSAA
jgi:signal transduction histidine kinase